MQTQQLTRHWKSSLGLFQVENIKEMRPNGAILFQPRCFVIYLEVSIFLSSLMTSFSSSHNNIVTPQALEWYKIRDSLVSDNLVKQNIRLALELAAVCEHPDALWLTSVFAGKNVKTREQACDVFLSLGENDARGLCFTSLLSSDAENWNLIQLRQSAELGFAFSQAWVAQRTEGEERFRFAMLAALQEERGGIYLLGDCFRFGIGCEKNLEKAKEHFLLATELGDVFAMSQLGDLLDDCDPKKWYWLGRAALRGHNYLFLDNFAGQVQVFNSGSGNAAVVFVIGRTLKGQVNAKRRTIFRSKIWNFETEIGSANQAIDFFGFQVIAARRAVDAWISVGIRLGVVKDIRIVIGKMIWGAREEARYVVAN